MRKYEILKRTWNKKVLVKWTLPNRVEYSVHTLTDDDELIWGHYYNSYEDAKEYFEEVTK